MTQQDETLTAAEQELAVARARGEVVVNSALNWIERFHAEADTDLLGRLFVGIKSLIRVMQGRSAEAIRNMVDELLRMQVYLALPSGDPLTASPGGSASTRQALLTRVHSPWAVSDYFAADQHQERPLKRRVGPVFVSYARADAVWLQRLTTHLRPLVRSKRIELWHDGMLDSGMQWRTQIQKVLEAASSAVVLLSANFMASDFIYTEELPRLADRARREGVVVFPLVIGHCLYEDDQYLRGMQMFNDPESPLSRLDSSDVDRILVKLAKAVRDFCDQVG